MNNHVNSFNKILVYLLNLDEKFEDEDKTHVTKHGEELDFSLVGMTLTYHSDE